MADHPEQDPAPRRAPGRPRARPLEVDRRHVLDAARALCAERGFDGTSMEAIAQRAKVARPSVYEQFGSRQALMAATVEDAATLLTDRIVDALAAEGEPWTDTVRRTFDAVFTLVEEEPDAFTVLLLAEQSPAFPAGSGLGGARQRVIGEIADVARRHWKQQHIETGLSSDLMALMLFTMGEAMARRQIADRLDKGPLIELLVRFSSQGLLALYGHPAILAAVDHLGGEPAGPDATPQPEPTPQPESTPQPEPTPDPPA